jgi:hypothetical protein
MCPKCDLEILPVPAVRTAAFSGFYLPLVYWAFQITLVAMFKRVEKRRRKKEEEEELGLDEEMKDVLGIHNTDSDESESDTDTESEGESESETGGGENVIGVKRKLESDAEDDEESEGEGSGKNDPSSKPPPISVQRALLDPLYNPSPDPNIRYCVVCPGKLLKNDRMARVHKNSKV